MSLMKAVYTDLEGKKWEVEYDPAAPCHLCGLPVGSASMGGTSICPWCDCGRFRDGTRWTYRDATDAAYRKARAGQHLPSSLLTSVWPDSWAPAP